MTYKTRQDKIDLLKSWEYTMSEWNNLLLWKYVDYTNKSILIKDAIKYAKQETITDK